MKPEISFLSPQRILNTLLKETAFNVTKILNHDLLKKKKKKKKKKIQSALAIFDIFEHGEYIIFAVHLTNYKMYLHFIESYIKITTYTYVHVSTGGLISFLPDIRDRCISFPPDIIHRCIINGGKIIHLPQKLRLLSRCICLLETCSKQRSPYIILVIQNRHLNHVQLSSLFAENKHYIHLQKQAHLRGGRPSLPLHHSTSRVGHERGM